MSNPITTFFDLIKTKLSAEELKALEAAKAAVIPVKMAEAKTIDGKIISYEGDLQGAAVNWVSAEGTKPVEPGTYELEDGTKIVVADGKVTAIEAKAPAVPVGADMSAVVAQMAAMTKSINASIEAQKLMSSDVAGLKVQLGGVTSIVDKILTTPVTESVKMSDANKTLKPVGEMSNHEISQTKRGIKIYK